MQNAIAGHFGKSKSVISRPVARYQRTGEVTIMAGLGRHRKTTGSAVEYHWEYQGTNDPSTWSAHYTNCGGSKQSPVNIDTTAVVHDANLGQISFNGYNATASFTLSLKNNGHSVVLNIGGTHNMHLSGGGLTENYMFHNLHFHWGSDDTKGSEHTVDGKAYPLEMHMVHFAKQYPNATTAKLEPKGLAVIGIFFKIGAENAKMNAILNHFTNVIFDDSLVDVPIFLIESVIPPDVSGVFYRYDGSLTTPTCDESVVWTVFKDPAEISATQMAKFRTIMMSSVGKTDAKLENNFRPIQAYNGRIVKTNDPSGSSSKSSTFGPVSVFILTLLLMIYMLQR